MAKKKAAVKKSEVRVAPERAKASAPPANKKRTSEQILASVQKLDQDILKLVNDRTKLATEWIQSQENLKSALFSPQIDDQMVAAVLEKNEGPMHPDAVRSIYRQLLSSARRQVRTQRVAYLGPAYSYSHQAALERFGESADLIPVNTIASVFEEVNRGHTEFGIVPIENSTDGRIVDTLDMFTRLPLRICGEVQVSIQHNLLAKCQRSEILEIYSKPQAFSQCRNWINRHMPQVRLHDVTSTSTAAQLARDKPGAAAIASSRAAAEYGLQLIAEAIQDNKNNVTRFAVIGDQTPEATGKDRTALLLQIPHRPGSLAD
ncbi:MAG: prephenate dehydratase domain-containing protein, partial [Pirellulaceae bacterium]